MTDNVDWTSVELDYRSGVLPIGAVAKKHGVSYSVVKSYAEKYGWERQELDPLLLRKAHGVASSPSGPKMSMDSDLSKADVVQAAIISAAAVIDIHRKDVRKLRESADKFVALIGEVFSVAHLASADDDVARQPLFDVLRRMAVLTGDAPPADLLERLSRVMVRLVQIERQAYGLDVTPVNPDVPSASSEVQNQVEKLWKQVQEIQKDKTVH